MKRRGKGFDGVPETPDLEATRGVVSDQILDAHALASEALVKAGIPHLLIGGLAVGAWGHPRATRDVDFLVRQADAFETHGKIVTFRRDVPIAVEGVTVDYLVAEDFGLAELFETSAMSGIVPIAALFALKLRAHRPQDRADISALIDAGASVPEIEAWLSARQFTTELKRLRAILSTQQDG